eukprot:CAMPEP_0174313942 /NCGR_PEP_ID=MMETSP0810-20121108/5323_1 /TAXON_ID=73025 ORGANISM="Eutreptiella gymnastica-like, Strain CCMP1594" /NCGR_SAMPLE_ID=MMETSP0810 /ASSEMBLY_ACC=CAM_ASM_000659 /LENGTH=39 /DNA_ID= /DNA_START= /DNA_END= /DNA_ORIENTATION=
MISLPTSGADLTTGGGPKVKGLREGLSGPPTPACGHRTA